MNVKHQHGFSLLEVIIAIAVLAFAMTALVEGAGRGAFNANYLKEKTLAHWVALNKIAEYQLQPTWPSVGLQKGTYDMANFDWRWEARVTETEDKNVRRLEMDVRMGPNSKSAMTKVTAFLDNPESVGQPPAPAPVTTSSTTQGNGSRSTAASPQQNKTTGTSVPDSGDDGAGGGAEEP